MTFALETESFKYFLGMGNMGIITMELIFALGLICFCVDRTFSKECEGVVWAWAVKKNYELVFVRGKNSVGFREKV